jgi:G3E family GTPase
MLDVVNPEDHAGKLHDHDHHDHGDGGEDQEMNEGDAEMQDEESSEEETEEAYQLRLVEAKNGFKKKREEGYAKMQLGNFKHLFRSKGFLWLSNRPNLFFEWSQASVQNNICVGGPWVCTLKGQSLEEQAHNKDIGDR